MRAPKSLGLCFVLLLILVTGSSGAQPLTDWGRSTLAIPPSTTEGNWYGTWYYVSKDFHIALWIRPGEGELPQVKLQLFRLGSDERFTTDWDGQASYLAMGVPAGSFSLSLKEGDANRLRAEWDWKLEFADSARVDHSTPEMFRSGDGRSLVVHFPEYERRIRRGAAENNVTFPQLWTFRKASRRQVLWDELPF